MTSGAEDTSWRRLLGAWPTVSAHHIFSWADQAVVSAASFLGLLLVARWTDAGQVGAYAIGISVITLLLASQDSLVTRPYSVQLFKPPGSAEEHAFSALVMSILLSGAAIVVMAGFALAFSFSGARQQTVNLILILAVVSPFVMLREFARRFAFANLLVFQALVLDATAALTSLAALIYLGWTGQLTANSAIVALGLACGVSSATWLIARRHSFRFRYNAVLKCVRQSWSLGKWLLPSHLAMHAQGFVTHWVSLVIAGAAATGVYSACLSIVALTNPFVIGFLNLMTPRSVRTLKNTGNAGLKRQAAFDSLLLATVMALFAALIILIGEDMMALLYPGSEYAKKGHILSVLALSALASSIGAPAANALSSAERGRAIAGLTIGTCIAGSILVWLLMNYWGLIGAVYGVLITETAGSIGRWLLLLVLLGDDTSPDSRSTIPGTKASPGMANQGTARRCEPA